MKTLKTFKDKGDHDMEYKYKGYVIKGSKGKGYCAFNGKTYVCADTLKIVKYKISIQISKGE